MKLIHPAIIVVPSDTEQGGGVIEQSTLLENEILLSIYSSFFFKEFSASNIGRRAQFARVCGCKNTFEQAGRHFREAGRINT